jgi:N-acetylmuramoyl-L-alanine amidase
LKLAWMLCALSTVLLGAASIPEERFDSIVIDAGHGGDDHGAKGPEGLMEKDLVLDVARRLAALLRADGMRVVLTREADVFVPLDRRAALANEARGDLFVSIHANAAPSRAARGIETFFLSLEASDDAARQVALRENEAFRGAVPASSGDDPLAALMGDLIATEHLSESDEFARLAHERLAAVDPVPSRGVKQAPFFVLMGVQMPASLIEIGFLTNPREERALATPERQDEIARALARAVREFGRRYDVRRGAAAGERAPSAAGGGM